MVRDMRIRSSLRFLLAAGTLLVIWQSAAGSAFEDDEACLMCHKYPRMGRMTQEGVFRSYHVTPKLFAKTVHRNVPCRDCHADNREYYEGVHEIPASRDPASPVSSQNRVETCKRCHESADPKYVDVDPHPSFDEEYNPTLHHAESIYGLVSEIIVVALLGLSRICRSTNKALDGQRP
jgi:hypothetical protein